MGCEKKFKKDLRSPARGRYFGDVLYDCNSDELLTVEAAWASSSCSKTKGLRGRGKDEDRLSGFLSPGWDQVAGETADEFWVETPAAH